MRKTPSSLAHHVSTLLQDEPDLMVVWEAGTLRRMGEHLDLELTLLGIDVQHGGTVHADLNEQGLLEVISAHTNADGQRPLLLLLSPRAVKVFSSDGATSNSHPMCSAPSAMATSGCAPFETHRFGSGSN